jgi:hypothetical protein
VSVFGHTCFGGANTVRKCCESAIEIRAPRSTRYSVTSRACDGSRIANDVSRARLAGACSTAWRLRRGIFTRPTSAFHFQELVRVRPTFARLAKCCASGPATSQGKATTIEPRGSRRSRGLSAAFPSHSSRLSRPNVFSILTPQPGLFGFAQGDTDEREERFSLLRQRNQQWPRPNATRPAQALARRVKDTFMFKRVEGESLSGFRILLIVIARSSPSTILSRGPGAW